MKTVLKILNLNTNEDVISIREVVGSNEGVIACEINLSKKEVNIVYDDKSLTIDKIIAEVEELGYSIN